MTAPTMSTDITWYRPEFPEDTPGHVCYCKADASGRTSYWDGHRLRRVWQCKKHLPVESATYGAVSR